MKERWIIFDETNGRSAKGKTLKWIAQEYGIAYVVNPKELSKLLEGDSAQEEKK